MNFAGVFFVFFLTSRTAYPQILSFPLRPHTSLLIPFIFYLYPLSFYLYLSFEETMEKMSFKENLLQKIELERLASKVIASCGTGQSNHPVDKEAMRSLLEMSPYQYQRERDLDLYVKDIGEGLKIILVLDNMLPIFKSTIKDVVTRRSPRTLEMWNFKTVRTILVDSDIKLSTRAKSVETVLEDTLAQLDLTYTDKDIENLAKDGMAWLAGRDAKGVGAILSLFAALLGYEKPQKYFGLENTISYGFQLRERTMTLSLGLWHFTVLLATPFSGLISRFQGPTVNRLNFLMQLQPAKDPFQ